MIRFCVYIFTCISTLSLFTTSNVIAQSCTLGKTVTRLQKVKQKHGLVLYKSLLDRIEKTPDAVIKMFRDAGMSPTEHKLTQEEIKIVASAIAALPPLHQRVLKQHLKSISFVDNMPNTALTAPITEGDSINLYHITFRAGILRQTITEWITEKERACFSGGNANISIGVEAGRLNALTYVLLHESTHVVDGSKQLLFIDTAAGKQQINAFTTAFSNGVWENINTHKWPVTDSIMLKSRFRARGRRYLSTEAAQVYKELVQSPFVSLYSAASWHEDLAELFTVYHLTNVYKEPFRIFIKQDGKVVQQFEPMKSVFVQKRLSLLRRFYAKA